MTLLKLVRQTLFWITEIGLGTTAMGFYSGDERLGSNPNPLWASENLGRNRGQDRWMENTKIK